MQDCRSSLEGSLVLGLVAGLAAAATLVAAVALAQADLPAQSHHASHCWNSVFAVHETTTETCRLG